MTQLIKALLIYTVFHFGLSLLFSQVFYLLPVNTPKISTFMVQIVHVFLRIIFYAQPRTN